MSTRVTRQQHTTRDNSTGLRCRLGSCRCTTQRWSQLKEGQSTPRRDYTKQRGDHQVDSGSLWAPLPAAICRGFAWRLQLPVSLKGPTVRRGEKKGKTKTKQNLFLETGRDASQENPCHSKAWQEKMWHFLCLQRLKILFKAACGTSGGHEIQYFISPNKYIKF